MNLLQRAKLPKLLELDISIILHIYVSFELIF